MDESFSCIGPEDEIHGVSATAFLKPGANVSKPTAEDISSCNLRRIGHRCSLLNQFSISSKSISCSPHLTSPAAEQRLHQAVSSAIAAVSNSD